MSTKGQRLQKRIAAKRGEQFALERAVLNAARVLMGSLTLCGRDSIPDVTWDRFIKAENALHEYHAERQRKSGAIDRKGDKNGL